MKKILIFSGPSGGHLFPAQALAEVFQEIRPEIKLVLVTSIRAEALCAQFPQNLFSEIVYLPEFGSPLGLSMQGIRSLLNIPAAMIQSWRLISRIRPALCIGFGSFVSFFGILFAAWRGIPTLIHEQNQVPGKATRMLQKHVKRIAVTFPKTYFRLVPSNMTVTGLPIRQALREGIIPLSQKLSQPFTVLICGGSQGSAYLNQSIMKTFSCLTSEERAAFAVIHITGNGQEEVVRRGYDQMQILADVYPFLRDMQLVYNRAHLAISRAGANSAFEQALYGIPTIFIPYPYAEGHQNDNAKYFVEKGGARVHAQNDAAPEWMAGILREWSKRPEDYRLAARQIHELSQREGHRLLFELARKMLES